jgi:hypothetical protein
MFEDHQKIFGLDSINPEETVYVTEGPFDSLFINNSIAMCGSDVDLSGYNYQFVYVFDNEPRNKQIVSKIATAVEQGYQVVIWPSTVKVKDINDMVLAGLNPSAIIKDNTFTGLEAKLRLNNWKKV